MNKKKEADKWGVQCRSNIQRSRFWMTRESGIDGYTAVELALAQARESVRTAQLFLETVEEWADK